MNTFLRFFYEFISIFFEGIWTIIKGIYTGFIEMFNINEYGSLINNYKTSFKGAEWVFVVISIIFLLIVVGLIVFLIYLSIRRFIRNRKNEILLENEKEIINNTNIDFKIYSKEKKQIMNNLIQKICI